MNKNSRLTQKALRRNTPRLTQEQKKSLLDFLDGDDDSRKIGIAMIDSYLSIHPNEKHFRKKFLLKKKTKEALDWFSMSTLKRSGVNINRPSSAFNFVNYTIGINDTDTTYEAE